MGRSQRTQRKAGIGGRKCKMQSAECRMDGKRQAARPGFVPARRDYAVAGGGNPEGSGQCPPEYPSQLSSMSPELRNSTGTPGTPALGSGVPGTRGECLHLPPIVTCSASPVGVFRLMPSSCPAPVLLPSLRHAASASGLFSYHSV